jgi:hypothetical protein
VQHKGQQTFSRKVQAGLPVLGPGIQSFRPDQKVVGLFQSLLLFWISDTFQGR